MVRANIEAQWDEKIQRPPDLTTSPYFMPSVYGTSASQHPSNEERVVAEAMAMAHGQGRWERSKSRQLGTALGR